MLENKALDKILFIDIETTSKTNKFSELAEKEQELFLKSLKNKGGKEALLAEDVEKAKQELYDRWAPIIADSWGKIICISFLRLISNNDGRTYKMKIGSFADKDEKKLLTNFVTKLDEYLNKTGRDSYALCAHNGLVFDYPIISKRLLINGIKLPKILDFADKKPWDVTETLIDTKKIFSFNVFDSNTSLDVLAMLFGVPSSKDDINGSQVKNVFYNENDGLERIKKYCEKDTVALAKIYLKLRCLGEEITD